MRKIAPLCAAASAAFFAASSAQAATAVAGTYVTDPSQTANAPVDATSSSSAAGDAISLQMANDATNLYLYVTFNSSVDGGMYVAVDSDNNPATGYAIYGSTLIGSNLGIQYDTGFTETAMNFNTDPSYFGNGSGSVVTDVTSSTTATTELLSIPLTTAQTDSGDQGGYTGLDFPDTFTLEVWQGSGNVVGPVQYTLATPVSVPEPASLGLLGGLAAVSLVRRRRYVAG